MWENGLIKFLFRKRRERWFKASLYGCHRLLGEKYVKRHSKYTSRVLFHSTSRYLLKLIKLFYTWYVKNVLTVWLLLLVLDYDQDSNAQVPILRHKAYVEVGLRNFPFSYRLPIYQSILMWSLGYSTVFVVFHVVIRQPNWKMYQKRNEYGIQSCRIIIVRPNIGWNIFDC